MVRVIQRGPAMSSCEVEEPERMEIGLPGDSRRMPSSRSLQGHPEDWRKDWLVLREPAMAIARIPRPLGGRRRTRPRTVRPREAAERRQSGFLARGAHRAGSGAVARCGNETTWVRLAALRRGTGSIRLAHPPNRALRACGTVGPSLLVFVVSSAPVSLFRDVAQYRPDSLV